MEGDGCEGLVLALDLDVFFCFDGLVQSVGPAATGHLTSGELVDDDDFAVFHDVIDVALVERVGAQGLVYVVNHFHVRGVVQIAETEQAFAFADAIFGERRLAMFFVERVVDVLDQLGDDFVDLVVLVGGFLGGAGNDQRGARFVDEDGVDFIDDREVMAALDAIREVVLHVVAQVVEAELVVGAVGDVCAVGGAALLVVEIVHDYADGEAQAAIERRSSIRRRGGRGNRSR